MGFKQHSNINSPVAPWEKVPVTADESYEVGEALVLAAGKATKCGAAATPEFICQQKLSGAAAGGLLSVSRVTELQELETTAAVALTDINVGDKVTLHTDGLQVTATKTGGVFLLSYIGGTAAGSVVRGYFRR